MMFLKLIGAGIIGMFLLIALANPAAGGVLILVGACIGLGVLALKAVGLW